MFKRFSVKQLVCAVSVFVALVIIMSTATLFSGCGGVAIPENNFAKLLGLTPSDALTPGGNAPVYFTLIDYARVYKDKNISFTSADELIHSTSMNGIIGTVIGEGSHITGYGNMVETSPILDKNVGYDLTNIDAEIQYGQPPNNCVVGIGRYSPQDTIDALKNHGE